MAKLYRQPRPEMLGGRENLSSGLPIVSGLILSVNDGFRTKVAGKMKGATG